MPVPRSPPKDLSLLRSLPTRATVGALAALVVSAAPAHAVNTVVTASGASWQVHDGAAPSLDTGSIRTITGNAFYGYGSIKVKVFDAPAFDPSTRFNGEAMRGFGLQFDGVDSFASTSPVLLDGIQIARSIKVSKPGNWTRWLDTYTNTTDRPITLTSSFGGTLGINTPNNQSTVAATSSGDTAISDADSWVEVFVPPAQPNPPVSPPVTATPRGPSATVLGTPAPFAAGFTGTGNHQRDPFTIPLPTTGLDANFYGFRNNLTLQPGQTRSLLHFAVAGTAETAATSGQQVAAVRTTATNLAATPDLTDIPTGLRCSVANFNVATTPGFDPAACATAKLPEVQAQRDPALARTTSPYPVVDKSITQMAADMAGGKTTSQEIVRAYLDRIAAYDVGAFGFHTYITVAKDAMQQAKAADDRRAAGATGDLLGIPVNVKDLYDTKDMPTTDGTLALQDWQPKKDAFQIARLRAAGAVILGKGNLSEFANSGSYSESGYMMTANAFKPSKTSLGSSGGPAVATALSLAGFGMGTQTGVSLYAPSTGASLVSLRGTDGISSGSGVMPLTYLQDFEGPIARTTSDVARILNVTTGTDPGDPATVAADADAKRPADWKTALDPSALKGKVIGYVPDAFDANLTYGQADGTVAALKARFADLQAAGATLVPITTPIPQTTGTGLPTITNDARTEEGWQHYWEQQENPPFTTAAGILSSPKNLPYNRRTQNPSPRLTTSEVNRIIAARDASKASVKSWMDNAGVDAVIYPGFRSDVYDNDGAQTLSSDRGTGVPTSNYGLPTLILPVGANPDGDPMSLQIVGRAFDDAKVLGFGYALEQQLGGKGHLVPASAPALAYDPAATPAPPVKVPAPIAPVTTSPTVPPEEKMTGVTTTSTVTTTAPARAATTPRLSVTLPKSGALGATRIRLSVKNTGATTATGVVTLTRRIKVRGVGRTQVLGRANVTVAAGATKAISVTLYAAGRRAVKGKKNLAVAASFALRASSAETATKVGVTLRR